MLYEVITVGNKTYKIKVQYYDDESTPARAGQLADRLIKQDGIKFILGPYGSGPTKGMAPITEKYKIPMVEGNGASRALFNKGSSEYDLLCNLSKSCCTFSLLESNIRISSRCFYSTFLFS